MVCQWLPVLSRVTVSRPNDRLRVILVALSYDVVTLRLTKLLLRQDRRPSDFVELIERLLDAFFSDPG